MQGQWPTNKRDRQELWLTVAGLAIMAAMIAFALLNDKINLH